jgi:predicted CDP-diglyceride synthetase/phosphatidate cytidylyltransferase
MLDVSPEAWRLVAGIAAVLVLASLSGCLLRIVVARSEAHPLIDNLNRRITSWWLIVIVVGLALLGGRSGITLLFALASLAALREFVVTGVQARCPRALLLSACLVIVPLAIPAGLERKLPGLHDLDPHRCLRRTAAARVGCRGTCRRSS